jgi:N-carbamoylputrescine amidase
MQDLAKETGMVVVAPMYEEDEKASGIYYNTAAVIDADGTYWASTARRTSRT